MLCRRRYYTGRYIDIIRYCLSRVLVLRVDTIIRSRLESESVSRMNIILDKGNIDIIKSGLVGVSSLKTGYFDQFKVSRCSSFKTRHYDQFRISRCISLKTRFHSQFNDKVNTFQGK